MKLSALAIPVIVGIIVGGAIFMIVLGQEKKQVTPQGEKLVQPTSAATPVKLLTWNDPAGFTFKYPEGLLINKHDEDNVNYAHLEFTSSVYPGNLIVWVKDTSTNSLDGWIKSDKRFDSASVIDTTFAGKPGKKILISSPSVMLVSGTIDDSILFTVETAALDKDFWTKLHETISGSFAFVQSDKVSAGGLGGAAGADNQAVDEEETLQ